MYQYINENESFKDLKSNLAKVNYNRIISCIESAIRPDIKYSPYYTLKTKKMNKEKFAKCLDELCEKVFVDSNDKMTIKDLIKNKMEIDLDGYPYGFTGFDINKEKFIRIEGGKYQISPIVAIHELTHALCFVKKSTIPNEFQEIMSMFNEMKAIGKNEAKLQDEWLFNRIVSRLNFRIYIEDLSDEALQSHPIDNKIYFDNYFRMLNFVYAFRLYEIYTVYPETIDKDITQVLNNEISIRDLLNKYNISLENEDTIVCFENKIGEYENIIMNHFNCFQKK